MIPAFDQQVPADGYAWWYIDAISSDRRHGLTLIAFIGSVFSPYYAWARGRGQGNPFAHCAINVALYGPGGRWCMTERGSAALSRESARLAIGPSALHWDGQVLRIDLREWGVPLPRPIRGRILVHPAVGNGDTLTLDPDGRHRWTPVFPEARVEVQLDRPSLSWSGSGYLDHNAGVEPLERCFESWYWSRATTRRGPVVTYDTLRSDGQHSSLALHFDRSGNTHRLATPLPVDLPRSRWGIARPTRSDNGQARIESVWEDTPFYARSVVATQLGGEAVSAVHESLSLSRFSAWWVQLMLPFRMPRRKRWRGGGQEPASQ